MWNMLLPDAEAGDADGKRRAAYWTPRSEWKMRPGRLFARAGRPAEGGERGPNCAMRSEKA